MSKTEHNHYLARNYLRAWAPTGQQIYQLDLFAETPKPKLVGVRHAAVERFLYSQEVEAHFERRIERPAWGVLDKLRAHAPVMYAELEPLLAYLVAQLVRTPEARDYLKTLSNPWAQNMIQTYQEQGIDLAAEGFGVDRLVSMHREEIPFAHSHQSEPGLRILRSLEWAVWRLGPVGEFITSDKPVTKVVDRTDRPISKLAFPLSPESLLVGGLGGPIALDGARFSSRFGNTVLESKRVSESDAQSVNRNSSAGANRFLYGRSPSALVAALPPMNPKLY
jgi:hypothetical protein